MANGILPYVQWRIECPECGFYVNDNVVRIIHKSGREIIKSTEYICAQCASKCTVMFEEPNGVDEEATDQSNKA